MAAKKKSRKSTSAGGGATHQSLDCNSPVVTRRLNRIADNYDQLSQLLSNLENRLPEDPIEPGESAAPNKPR